MLAQLYQNHPYGRPVLGWAHEIKTLSRDDAVRYYRSYYSPANAVLVVVGDVTADEVRYLAQASYGKNRAGVALPPRIRPTEPEPVAARWVRLEDARSGSPLLLRFYLAPSFASSSEGEAEALAVLARVLGGDDTSRLYRRLVLETKVAVQAGADYQGGG